MKRQISNIEESGRQKYILFINGEVYASLYRGEVRRLKLETGMEWTEALEAEVESVLYKRGKERSLYLLQQRAYTRAELRNKLHQNGYAYTVIEKILHFLQDYSFLDDRQYAEAYVHGHENRYSRKQMKLKLLQKGLDKAVIEDVLTASENPEAETAYRILKKRMKHKAAKSLTREEQWKEITYLGNKGFSYDIATQCMQRFLSETEML